MNRANWIDGLSSQGNRGGNNQANRGNDINRRMFGQQGATGQQFGGQGDGARNSFRRSEFAGQGNNGRVSDEQLRNFLNMRQDNRGNATAGGGNNNRFGDAVRRDGGGRGGEFNGAMQDRVLGNRTGGPDRDNGNRPGDGIVRGQGDGRRGDGGRGDGNSRDRDFSRNDRGDGRPGDGRPGGGNRNFDGRRGDGPDGIGRNGDGRGRNNDGRDGNWRDGDGRGRGDGRNWRGGDLGKGDHRDWSGKWRDGKRFDTANHIRDDWRGRNWKNRNDIPFHGDWWNRGGNWHGNRRWNHWGWWAGFYGRPNYWWGWATWPRLNTWLAFNWGTPYYWDYGPGEYIYCYNDVIYVNGRWFEPAPVYYNQTVVLAQSAPDFTPQQAQQIEWLPLGVFAVSTDGVVDNNLLVQLAVTKDGVIGGTVMNQATGETFDLEGTVDKQSQRAVWTYKDAAGRQVAMETSINNLTQSEATAMVHYGPNEQKVVELVRLEQPGADAQAGGAAVDVAKPQANVAPEVLPAPLPVPPAPTNPPVTPDVR